MEAFLQLGQWALCFSTLNSSCQAQHTMSENKQQALLSPSCPTEPQQDNKNRSLSLELNEGAKLQLLLQLWVEVAAGAPSSWWQCLFSSSAALVPAFSPFWDRTASDRFSSCAWWAWRNCESFYKSSFALQSLLKQHHSKPAGCHISQASGWQLSCHVRANGKWGGRDPLSLSLSWKGLCIDWKAKISACPLTFGSQSLALMYSGQKLLLYSQVPWNIGQGHF